MAEEEYISDGLTINGQWRKNAKKFFWKLLFTLSSAKFLAFVGAAIIATTLLIKQYSADIIVNLVDGSQGIVTVHQPYITGQNWTDLIVAITVAFMGARLMPTLTREISETVSNHYAGKRNLGTESVEPDEEEGA